MVKTLPISPHIWSTNSHPFAALFAGVWRLEKCRVIFAKADCDGKVFIMSCAIVDFLRM